MEADPTARSGQRWEWWHEKKAVEGNAARPPAWVMWGRDKVPFLAQDAGGRKMTRPR